MRRGCHGDGSETELHCLSEAKSCGLYAALQVRRPEKVWVFRLFPSNAS